MKKFVIMFGLAACLRAVPAAVPVLYDSPETISAEKAIGARFLLVNELIS